MISRSIGQTLSNDSLDGDLGALDIVDPKANAVRIAEIKLVQISVQVFFLAMLIDALHAAFEDRIIALDGVGRNEFGPFPADVFIYRMIHGVMAGERLADLPVRVTLIGHHLRFLGEIGVNDVAYPVVPGSPISSDFAISAG